MATTVTVASAFAFILAAVAHAQVPAVRPPVGGAPAGVTAFVGVNVVPMDTERVLADQTVLVEGGRITALGPSAKITVPVGAARIDGRGQFLIPGLAEMHAHLSVDTAVAERNLFRLLASGVTTVRTMDYTPNGRGETALALRARAAAGTLLSPRIYASGHLLWADRKAIAPEAVAARVAAYKAAGYDHFKYHDDLDLSTPRGRAVWDSLVAAAQRVGLPITGHLPDLRHYEGGTVGWFERHPGAIRSIEHMGIGLDTLYPYLLNTVAPELERPAANYAAIETKVRSRATETLVPLASAIKRAGTWICPTLLLASGTEPLANIPPGDKRLATIIYHRGVEALRGAGAGLLLGTDLSSAGPRSGTPGEQLSEELRSMVAAGLTPYQALLTGTRNVAEYYGTLEEGGTVAVGKRADLVLLRGNPLADVRHVADPAGVMLGGRWLPRAELDRRQAALTTGAATGR